MATLEHTLLLEKDERGRGEVNIGMTSCCGGGAPHRGRILN